MAKTAVAAVNMRFKSIIGSPWIFRYASMAPASTIAGEPCLNGLRREYGAPSDSETLGNIRNGSRSGAAKAGYRLTYEIADDGPGAVFLRRQDHGLNARSLVGEGCVVAHRRIL